MPVPERNVIVAGVRDLEPHQRKRLERSELLAIPGAIDVECFDQAVRELATRTARVNLRVDLDSIDISDAKPISTRPAVAPASSRSSSASAWSAAASTSPPRRSRR